MASSTFSSSLTKEWLSLPHDFSVDDSFADDLIQQFDKKRNSLQDLLVSPSILASFDSINTLPYLVSPPFFFLSYPLPLIE